MSPRCRDTSRSSWTATAVEATQRACRACAGTSRERRRGARAVRRCARQGVEYLTLFAFSSENWRRPNDEVSFLMRTFVPAALEHEIGKLARKRHPFARGRRSRTFRRTHHAT